MGIGTRIALFVGVPAIIIIVVGFALRTFQPTIFSSASAIGETLAGIFTRPVTGFVGSISQAFADLPDIDVKVPGINLTSGLFTFTQEQQPRDIGGETGMVPGGTVEFQPGTMFDPNTGIIEGSPPVITPDQPFIPEAEASELTPRQGSLAIEIAGEIQSLPISEIIKLTPGIVGLFDILSTPKTEFLPLSLSAIEFFQEQGQELKLSGQIFQEIKNIGDIDF